jgi:hypothetical protein
MQENKDVKEDLPWFYTAEAQQMLSKRTIEINKIVWRDYPDKDWNFLKDIFSDKGTKFINALDDILAHREEGWSEQKFVESVTKSLITSRKKLINKFPDLNFD